jgi:hypothetical protein
MKNFIRFFALFREPANRPYQKPKPKKLAFDVFEDRSGPTDTFGMQAKAMGAGAILAPFLERAQPISAFQASILDVQNVIHAGPTQQLYTAESSAGGGSHMNIVESAKSGVDTKGQAATPSQSSPSQQQSKPSVSPLELNFDLFPLNRPRGGGGGGTAMPAPSAGSHSAEPAGTPFSPPPTQPGASSPLSPGRGVGGEVDFNYDNPFLPTKPAPSLSSASPAPTPSSGSTGTHSHLIQGPTPPPSGPPPGINSLNLYVVDVNNGLVLTPYVAEDSFSNWTEELHADVSCSNSAVAVTYAWDFTNAPDAGSTSGGTTYKATWTWNNFSGAVRSDSVKITVSGTGVSSVSQTIVFNVASTSSPAYVTNANRPSSSSTWPNVMPPDSLTGGQEFTGTGDYYGLGVYAGNVQTSHTLPTYHPSIPALSLTYDSEAAYPQPIFIVHHALSASQSVPATVNAQLTFNGMAGTNYSYTTSLLEPGDTMEIALQVDANTLATGRYSYSITIVDNYPTAITTTYSGSANLVSYKSSPFGQGWWLDGLEQITSVTGGVILNLGAGNTLWFANGVLVGTFVTPAGDSSTLSQSLIDSTYTRTLKDGTTIHFNSSGYQTSVVDPNANTFTYAYNGSNQLTQIKDFENQLTTLTYSSNVLNTIQDPDLRLTTFTAGSGRVTQIQDPDGALWTYSYDSTSGRINGLTNPDNAQTTFAYSSGRVSSVTLPIATDTESLTTLQTVGKRPTNPFLRV